MTEKSEEKVLTLAAKIQEVLVSSSHSEATSAINALNILVETCLESKIDINQDVLEWLDSQGIDRVN